MLKKLLTATLSCLKKTCAVAATCVVKLAEFVVNVLTKTGDVLTEGWNWLGTAMRKPRLNSTSSSGTMSSRGIIMSAVKMVFLQRFFLFLGGLLCVFVLPSEVTNNDLTWFEGMLNSVKNLVYETSSSIRERATMKVRCMFQPKAVT